MKKAICDLGNGNLYLVEARIEPVPVEVADNSEQYVIVASEYVGKTITKYHYHFEGAVCVSDGLMIQILENHTTSNKLPPKKTKFYLDEFIPAKEVVLIQDKTEIQSRKYSHYSTIREVFE